MSGKILFIEDLVTYEAADVASLQVEFRAAVDDYLDTCTARGRKPRKPFGGVFNVRTSPERHKALSLQAHERRTSLNAVVNEAIDAFLGRAGVSPPVEAPIEKPKPRTPRRRAATAG